MERAISCNVPTFFSLLMDSILGKWDLIIESALVSVKNNLPVGLSSDDLILLNEIIADCNFKFQIE